MPKHWRRLWRRLRGWRLLLAGVLALLYVALAQLAFQAGLILPVVYPLLALVVAAASVLVISATSAAGRT